MKVARPVAKRLSAARFHPPRSGRRISPAAPIAATWLTITRPTPATRRERLAAMLTGNQGDESGHEAEREAQP
ncbi:MAG: hypothetical protein WCB27_10530 [Thermoguttaceae bacterium]